MNKSSQWITLHKFHNDIQQQEKKNPCILHTYIHSVTVTTTISTATKKNVLTFGTFENNDRSVNTQFRVTYRVMLASLLACWWDYIWFKIWNKSKKIPAYKHVTFTLLCCGVFFILLRHFLLFFSSFFFSISLFCIQYSDVDAKMLKNFLHNHWFHYDK